MYMHARGVIPRRAHTQLVAHTDKSKHSHTHTHVHTYQHTHHMHILIYRFIIYLFLPFVYLLTHRRAHSLPTKSATDPTGYVLTLM